MNRPLVAALATTVVVVVIAVVAVAIPWSDSGGPTEPRTAIGAPQRSAPTNPDQSRRYVALGSSYASGPDTRGIVDARCLRTGDDYPHQVAAAMQMALTDVTCAGSIIPDILDRAQPGRADAPQIDAVTEDTDLVTITTGGNDIGYIGRLTAISCANQLLRTPRNLGHRCRDEPPRQPPGAADFDRLRVRLMEVVDAVRARAPGAVVVIVTYIPVLDRRATLCPEIPLSPAEAAATVATFDGLTDATRRAAQATGSTLVDAAADGQDHAACSASPWVNGYRMPAAYHPNARGRAAMARLTLDMIAGSDQLQPRPN